MRKAQSSLFASIAGAALAITGAGCHSKEVVPETPVQSVRAGLIETARSGAPERYSVTFSPLTDVNLAFNSPGLIVRILQVRGPDGQMRDVQPGDKVPEGAELALVRQIDYQQKVDAAHGQLRLARAQLAQAEVGLEHAEIDYKRSSTLYQSASLIKPEYDRAKAQLDGAKAQVEASKAAVANAEVGVSEAALSLRDTSLKAPFSGWLTARNVDRGSMVSSAVVGFSMLDSHIVKANFAIPDTSLRYVRIGQRISVAIEALQRSVTGVVNTISPQADPKTHVFTVEVYIPNRGEQIRPGMLGSVTLASGNAPATHPVAPLSAVVRDPGNANGFAVYVLQERGGKTYASARAVTLGDTFGNAIEIRSGAMPGERIVTLGGELLRNGQEVRTIP